MTKQEADIIIEVLDEMSSNNIWPDNCLGDNIGNIGKSCFYINTGYPSERDK